MELQSKSASGHQSVGADCVVCPKYETVSGILTCFGNAKNGDLSNPHFSIDVSWLCARPSEENFRPSEENFRPYKENLTSSFLNPVPLWDLLKAQRFIPLFS